VKIELDHVGGLGMVFCNVAPFSMLDRKQYIGRTCSLSLEDKKFPERHNLKAVIRMGTVY